MIKTEVLIIGGGPAGSACAHRLKQHGIDCIILDRAMFPRTKLCAGWVTPEVFEDLEISPSDYPHGIIALKKLHVRIKGIKFPVPTLQYSIRRYEFDHWLLQRADVSVKTHSVKNITQFDDGYVVDDTYFGKHLIGAGGTYCPVYKTFFKNIYDREESNYIATQEEEFKYSYTDDRCYLWFMENGLPGYAWYVPKANGYLNVGVGGKATGLNSNNDTIKRHWDILVKKLHTLGLVRSYEFKPTGHCYYLRDQNPAVRIGNVFLIGDAAGLATVDMGEGIGPAIRSGIHAADAIAKGTEYTLDTISRRSLRVKWLRLI